jgi:hypothetical protein
MNEQPIEAQAHDKNQVLMAVRLGWLIVEIFGRLRRLTRGRKPRPRPSDKARRFAFSTEQPRSLDELLWNIDQLHHTLARFDCSFPEGPIPTSAEAQEWLTSELDLDAFHTELDTWSKQVWGVLIVEDEEMGRAFRYGGSLADTYWHAEQFGRDPPKAAALLRPERLAAIERRFDRIAHHLPPYTAYIIQQTLRRWAIAAELSEANIKEVLNGLGNQARVWRNLLFGSRSAESYLTTANHRWIKRGARGAVIGLMAIIIVVVYVVGSFVGELIPKDSGSNGDWSAFVGAVSSLVIAFIAFVSYLATLLKQTHHQAETWLKRRLLARRAYRGWQRRQDER